MTHINPVTCVSLLRSLSALLILASTSCENESSGSRGSGTDGVDESSSDGSSADGTADSNDGTDGWGVDGTTGEPGSDAADAADGSAGGGDGIVGDGDFEIAPPYEAAPETFPNDQVPSGTVTSFSMSSQDSAAYPLAFATNEVFSRDVAVYVPAQYVAGTEAPFIVVQDGISFYQSTMVPVLDNLIAAGEIPAMVAIFVEPGPDGGTPDGERSYEYDSVTDKYVGFVELELLPRVEAEAGVLLTKDPEGRAAMGGSSGGAAAFTMGWMRPDAFRRILTYSGSFCDLQPTADYPDGSWEYHESLIASSPKKPLRVALSASENDFNWNTDTLTKRDWVEANRAMAAALAAKGYEYRFVYAAGADHVDWNVLQATLPDTLRWLWKGY